MTYTFDQARIERVHRFLRSRVADGGVRALAMCLSLDGGRRSSWSYGTRDGEEPVTPKSRFLVASLSKPVTAAVLMRLVEAGELTLQTPVSSVLPSFTGEGREKIRVIHLLTHTSGLPDMVAQNVALRERHAPLGAFFDEVCRTKPLFESGSDNSYQSMGFVVISTLVERLTGRRFAEFAREELFVPAGMYDTHFGLPDHESGAEDVQVELPEGQREIDYHWNSPYWRRLGAPWGGLISTVGDLTTFLRLFVERGPLAKATARAMTTNRLRGLGPRFSAWGLGFKIKGESPDDVGAGAGHGSSSATSSGAVGAARSASDIFASPGAAHNRTYFGELSSAASFGHSGATGCVMWLDPSTSLSCVLLTSNPRILRDAALPRVANMVAASVG